MSDNGNVITIDTNVFIHLMNPENNTDNHIDFLLSHLQEEEYLLCVDDRGRHPSFIEEEYNEHINPEFKKAFDVGSQRYILSYWINYCGRHKIPINRQDALFQAIKRIIVEDDENVDRTFVTITLTEGCALVTNDGVHILNRRGELLGRKTKRFRVKGSEIIDSLEAHQKFAS